MNKTVISKESFIPIKKFGYKGYILHFDCADIDDTLNNVVCSEDTITVENNTKDDLIKAIVEYKYSSEDINLILCSKINNVVTPEYTKYIDWVEYAKKCASIIFDAPTLENAIKDKVEEIIKYDSSSAVNSFTYQGNDYWLDKATRVGLMNSTKILKDSGQTTTTLWLNDTCITLPVDDVIAKLSLLEQYALSCYNVTASHKIAVQGMVNIEQVKAYDVTQGYPTKLDLT